MRIAPVAILAAAFALTAPAVSAQQTQQLAPPMPYKPVPVTLPQPVSDPTFTAFRQQLGTIAEKKDRNALAAIVAQNFFWVPEDQDIVDKRKSAVDNLVKALDLDGPDAPGWDTLAAYAAEPTADPIPDPQRKGVLCAPGQPSFDEKAAMDLAAATKTDPGEWGYPAREGIEVRSGPEDKAPVAEKLGLHLVRVYPDDSPAGAMYGDVIRIVLPNGKLGFVPIELVLPLATDQLCYAKDGAAWKIAGVIGGGTPGK
jgi:hypothetical protein